MSLAVAPWVSLHLSPKTCAWPSSLKTTPTQTLMYLTYPSSHTYLPSTATLTMFSNTSLFAAAMALFLTTKGK